MSECVCRRQGGLVGGLVGRAITAHLEPQKINTTQGAGQAWHWQDGIGQWGRGAVGTTFSDRAPSALDLGLDLGLPLLLVSLCLSAVFV